MGFIENDQTILSKIATNNGHGEDSPYFDGWKAYDNDPFHPIDNPNGVIQMGLAENQLSFDIIVDWIKKHPKASVCTNEGVHDFMELALFQDYHGLSTFREAIAKFMGRIRGGKATFDPDHVVMSGGATGAAETISFCLADVGDAFLVPSPYYPAFGRDFGWRTGVKLIPIVCESSNNFKITITALEAAYQRAQEANIKVKGLLINNPSNPLGTVLDKDTLISLVRFINQKNIHLVCDEIYAATVFEKPGFVSISEVIEETEECDRNLVHVLFGRDFGWRTGVKLIPIVCESSNNFKITITALEAAYQRAQEANIKVKGLLINNPSNPLGTVLDKDTLISLVKFINQKNIHLVCDEIYAATVFEKPGFVSISEVIEETEECDRNLVHVLSSLSKDMGLPGFRVGIIYSYNKSVVNCARKMSSFGLVSTQTQHLVASLLSDDEFVDRFLSESSKRLAKRHKTLTQGLDELGIGSLKSNAGLFFWMDLRSLLKEATFEAEMSLWRVIINDVKLNVSPGSSFQCSEAGWFRVCFANMDDETVEIALGRIRKFMAVQLKDDNSSESLPPAKKPRWMNNLRVSFSRRCEEIIIMTPRMMSPHSPMPSSPLVRTRT